MSKGSILVLDDEQHPRKVLKEACLAFGYSVTEQSDPQSALAALRFGNFDVLLCDMQMPAMNGLEVLRTVRGYCPTVSVVMITAHGTVETAVKAMKDGAEDFILKPVDLDALELTLERIFNRRALLRQNQQLKTENMELKRELQIRYHMTGAIGQSEKSKRVLAEVTRQMKVRTSVVVLGESGTGRSEIAKMIHYNSPWCQGPLIVFDCTEVPAELHHPQLFGEDERQEAGVRIRAMPGLVERAAQGTLLILNIHRLDPGCHPLLSKVMREKVTHRRGGTTLHSADTRVVATSTHSELDQAVQTKRMAREFHTLLLENVIELPALRDRKEDLPLLVAAITRRLSVSMGRNLDRIDPAVIERLSRSEFPGNIRELSGRIENALIRCPIQDNVLRAEHFEEK